MKYLCYLLILLLSSIRNWGQITNIKAGLWSDKTTWNSNSIPIFSDSVILNFDVTVDIDAFCKSINVSGHAVTVSPGIHLTILGDGGEQQLNSGLLAYYPFNGGAKDESGNGYDLIISGASVAENRFGTTQKAYNFNGISDFMKIPAILKADSLREFTISIWVKPINLIFESFISLLPKDPRTCSNVLSFDNNSTRYSTWHRLIHDFQPGRCSSTIIKDTIDNPINSWVHIILIQRYVGTSPIYAYDQYCNGKKLKSTSSPYGLAPTPTSFSRGGAIGCNNTSNDSTFNFDFVKGAIDDIRIYNRALTSEEVKTLYILNE